MPAGMELPESVVFTFGPHRLGTTCAPAVADLHPLKGWGGRGGLPRGPVGALDPRTQAMRARPSAVTPPLHCQQPALVILQRSFEISRVVRLRLGRKAALSRCMESRSARLATCTQEPVLLSREWTASQDDESGPGLAGWSDAPVRYGTAAGPYWDPTEIRR